MTNIRTANARHRTNEHPHRSPKRKSHQYEIGHEVHVLFNGYAFTTPCKLLSLTKTGYNVETDENKIYSVTHSEVKKRPITKSIGKPKSKKAKTNSEYAKRKLGLDNDTAPTPKRQTQQTSDIHPKRKCTENDQEQQINDEHEHNNKTSTCTDSNKQPRQGQG